MCRGFKSLRTNNSLSWACRYRPMIMFESHKVLLICDTEAKFLNCSNAFFQKSQTLYTTSYPSHSVWHHSLHDLYCCLPAVLPCDPLKTYSCRKWTLRFHLKAGLKLIPPSLKAGLLEKNGLSDRSQSSTYLVHCTTVGWMVEVVSSLYEVSTLVRGENFLFSIMLLILHYK